MKSRTPLALLAVALAVLCACALRPVGLEQAAPEDAGLTWRECPANALESMQVEACLGPYPVRDEADRGRYGVRANGGLRLELGGVTYQTRHVALGVLAGWPPDAYVLQRNGRPLALLFGVFETYDPDLSLQTIAGQAAWEFADAHTATIIYGGRDLRRVYGLQAAYRPYELGGKLAFIGKRAGRYFLVYDGKQVGPSYERMPIAYCCETMLYAPTGAGGHYRFWGYRDGRLYAVDVSADAILPRAFKGWELYSWQAGNEWRYTLILGTNRNKTYEEITAEGSTEGSGLARFSVTGTEDLKAVLARLPRGETVFWAGETWWPQANGTRREFAPPDPATVEEIGRYCEERGIELVRP